MTVTYAAITIIAIANIDNANNLLLLISITPLLVKKGLSRALTYILPLSGGSSRHHTSHGVPVIELTNLSRWHRQFLLVKVYPKAP